MTLWTLLADFFALDPTLIPLQVEHTAFIPIAIAAVSAAGSLYSKYKEGKDARDQANKGNEMTERARQQAMQRLSPEQMYTAFQNFFPGLVSAPGSTNDSASPYTGAPVRAPNEGTPTAGVGTEITASQQAPNQGAGYQAPNPAADRNAAWATREGFDVARAQGGPVQDGQNVLVGEQGPEVVQMEGNGNVIPNPTTQQQQTAPVPAANGVPNPTGLGQTTGGAGVGTPGGGTQPVETTPPTTPTTPGAPGDQASPPTQYSGFDSEPVTANQLMMDRVFEMLANPGQFSTADYERRQEDASAGYQSRVQDINAQAMAGGIDPGSGVAGSMKTGAAMQESKLRSEAARDQQMLEQQLKRADIGAGAQMFTQMMNYILSLQGARANAAQGQFSNPAVVNTDMGGGIAQFGDLVGQAIGSYNANKPTASDDKPVN